MFEGAVIPTLYKTKIPGFLSYPIGAEALSSSLADTPQIDELKLSFFWYSKQKVIHSPKYKVLEVRYFRGAPSLTDGKAAKMHGWLEKKWEIVVSPVPRERKHLIRTLLESHALPAAKEWLRTNGDRNEIGGLSVAFTFDEELEALVMEKQSWLSPQQA